MTNTEIAETILMQMAEPAELHVMTGAKNFLALVNGVCLSDILEASIKFM
jgi:hypothetical protein